MWFDRPQLLLLLLLLPLYWRHFLRGGDRILTVLRLLLAAVVILVICGPRASLVSPGVDVIAIADRSASLGNGGQARVNEILSLLDKAKGSNDRVAIINFAAGDPQTSKSLTQDSSSSQIQLDPYGSELGKALQLAAQMASPTRRTRLLVISDGMYSSISPLSRNVLSSVGNLPISYRVCGAAAGNDISAGNIQLPQQVSANSGFIIRFSINSPQATTAQYELLRNRTMIARGKTTLQPGENWLAVRDIAGNEGICEYTLRVSTDGDTSNDNNISRALLQVSGPARVLLASSQDRGGVIEKALRTAGIPVETVKPEEFFWNSAALTPYKVIILENCPIDSIGVTGARNIAQAVENGVCSLLVTGGKGSFGLGGYYKSPLDKILPVSMELRNEQRKGRMALAIVMDRSGSMMAPVGSGGKTKMDLANISSAESIRLLTPADEVSVIAVDSDPHVIVPLSQADDTDKLVDVVLSIQSMGGGIFVYNGLKGALDELKKSNIKNRNILLFSDAADSEQQQGCVEMAREMGKQGINISIIGLGSKRDSDAAFLENLAKEGSGQIYFTTDALDLPRLFSQEVIRISRRGFIGEMTATTALPDMLQLGINPQDPTPQVGGYNLTSLRDGATGMMISQDEYKAPLIAFRQKGRTATAAILCEVDGEYSGKFSTWDNTPKIILNLVRQLAQRIEHKQVKAYSKVNRARAEVEFEFEDDVADKLRARESMITLLRPDGKEPLKTKLIWTGPSTATAEIDLNNAGHYLPLLDLGEQDGLAKAPPLSLPYSPEFAIDPDLNGAQILANLATFTGGNSAENLQMLFSEKDARAQSSSRDISTILIIIALALFILETAHRRTGILNRLRRKKSPATV